MTASLQTPQSLCRMGVARGDITPPVGIYHRMWGAAAHDRSTGIHRPLTATAVVFQPWQVATTSDEQIVLGIDHCLLWAREMEELLGRVAAAAEVSRETIVVAFSHTHAAGLMDTSRAALPGGELIAPYLEALAETLAELVRQARSAMVPATLVYGAGHCALAAERDFWDAERGQYVCGFNPKGSCDDRVLVARATDEQGQTLATIVNYACHPTTLAWENTLISPDYPSAMREIVEGATNAPCLFLQGASGDVGPREGFVGDTRIADRNGRQLGYAAMAALEGLPPPQTQFQYMGPRVSGATLATWAHAPLTQSQLADKRRWRLHRCKIDLNYRDDLPKRDDVAAERRRWSDEEKQAQVAGDADKARESRARIERCDRQLTRLNALPAGKSFPMPVTAWQMGDAVWLAIEGELYNVFERALREGFPQHPLMLITLANGSRCSYLPATESYGKGLYQESVAVLAPGCLEQLEEAVKCLLNQWLLTG